MKGLTTIVAPLVLVASQAAWPCSCDGWTPFDQVGRRASLVVAARVVGQYPIRDATLSLLVGYIEIEVLRTLKGEEVGPRLRIWDQDVLTSCRHWLSKLTVGTFAVFALRKDVLRREDVWGELRRQVEAGSSPEDYLLANCREQWRVFGDEKDLRKYMGSGRAAGRRSNSRLQRTALRAAAEPQAR